MPGAPVVVSAGPHEVRAARSPRPAPARPRTPLTRSQTILTIKERASACGEESPGWQVLHSAKSCPLPPPPPTQGRPSDPEDAGWLPRARGASSPLVSNSSAPSARQGGLELERSWGSWRSGTAGGRERSGGSGAAPSCTDPGGAPRPAI